MTRACFGCGAAIVIVGTLTLGAAPPAGQARTAQSPQSLTGRPPRSSSTSSCAIAGRPHHAVGASSRSTRRRRQRVDRFTASRIAVASACRVADPCGTEERSRNASHDVAAPARGHPPRRSSSITCRPNPCGLAEGGLLVVRLAAIRNSASASLPRPGYPRRPALHDDRTACARGCARHAGGASAEEQTAERTDELRDRRRQLGDQSPRRRPEVAPR